MSGWDYVDRGPFGWVGAGVGVGNDWVGVDWEISVKLKMEP